MHKDLEAKGQLYQLRARFEALFMGVLTAVSNLGRIFFRILTSGIEQCAWERGQPMSSAQRIGQYLYVV